MWRVRIAIGSKLCAPAKALKFLWTLYDCTRSCAPPHTTTGTVPRTSFHCIADINAYMHVCVLHFFDKFRLVCGLFGIFFPLPLNEKWAKSGFAIASTAAKVQNTMKLTFIEHYALKASSELLREGEIRFCRFSNENYFSRFHISSSSPATRFGTARAFTKTQTHKMQRMDFDLFAL